MITKEAILNKCKIKYNYLKRKLNSISKSDNFNKVIESMDDILVDICPNLFKEYDIKMLPQIVNYSNYRGIRFNIYITVGWYTVSKFIYFDMNTKSFSENKLEDLISDLLMAYYSTLFTNDGSKPIKDIVDSYDLILALNIKKII